MAYLIGITGGIGGGKSTVSGYLAEMGATVIDTDRIARELTQPGSDALPLIRDKFGDAVFRDDGTFDRKAMADIVFKDKAKLAVLNSILHPMVRRRWQLAAEECTAPYAFVVIPLLYENSLQDEFGEVWLVTADREERISRVMKRDGAERDAVVRRMENQLSENEKSAKANVVIDTTYGYEHARHATEEALAGLKVRLGIA